MENNFSIWNIFLRYSEILYSKTHKIYLINIAAYIHIVY